MTHVGMACILLLLAGAVVLTTQARAQHSETEASLEEIHNYTRISDDLASSGQVNYDQIAAIKEAGFEVVINLAPASDDMNGLEGFLVVEQGMSYIHIPVSWREPAQRDLQLFFDVMNANRDRKVYVHCFANMRASAFVYLYRTLEQHVAEDKARADMAKIWKPEDQEQWAHFIATARAHHDSGS